MQKYNLQDLANTLNESDLYRVIKKYTKPEFYNLDDNSPKKIGVFLDIEATGLSYSNDKLIELGMVKFEYSEDGRIFRLLEEFNHYQDPQQEISPFITKLTGIDNDMVQGRQIEESLVDNYLKDTDIIIAHNAQFDRSFFEKTFPNIDPKAWGCSMFDIDWNNEDIESLKLEYIAYKYNFFYQGHRAITDCLAGINIMAQTLYNSKQLVLKKFLDNALQLRFKLWATNAPYHHKDLLKERGYRWSAHKTKNYKAWSIELTEGEVQDEINYLRSNIYNNSINIPIELLDPFNRFSLRSSNSLNYDSKYHDKVQWLNSLQQSDTA